MDLGELASVIATAWEAKHTHSGLLYDPLERAVREDLIARIEEGLRKAVDAEPAIRLTDDDTKTMCEGVEREAYARGRADGLAEGRKQSKPTLRRQLKKKGKAK